MSGIPFEVEAVVVGSGIVLARRLTECSFALGEEPKLGGVAIERVLSMPRALDANGKPRLDLFAFRPVAATDLAQFKVGEVLELEGANAG